MVAVLTFDVFFKELVDVVEEVLNDLVEGLFVFTKETNKTFQRVDVVEKDSHCSLSSQTLFEHCLLRTLCHRC